MGTLITKSAFLAVALALTGCTSTDAVRLQHPLTGMIATCGPYAYSPKTADTAAYRERTCINDFRAQGYVRLPN